MAFGKHWEWRGFGALRPVDRERLQALPRKFPGAQEVTDKYLYVPTSPVNIKLRFSDLKFKRRLETAGPLELWLEDPAENYGFPLQPEVLARLAADLGIRLGDLPRTAIDLTDLVARLDRATPRVELIAVEKTRWQHTWQSAGDPEPVTVELAQIHSPHPTWSVGIEHPRPQAVLAALSALEPGLAKLNYLEALAIWARGDTVR